MKVLTQIHLWITSHWIAQRWHCSDNMWIFLLVGAVRIVIRMPHIGGKHPGHPLPKLCFQCDLGSFRLVLAIGLLILHPHHNSESLWGIQCNSNYFIVSHCQVGKGIQQLQLFSFACTWRLCSPKILCFEGLFLLDLC
jgi:hypothetical protein